jgi:aspartyl-tRNA synthetase
MSKLLEIGRSHTCGELREHNLGTEVVLMGWVGAWRDLGGRRFIDLRDRYGVTQVTFGEELDAELSRRGKQLRSEWVIALRGVVEGRVANGGSVNANLPTGSLEVRVTELDVLSRAETPPFQISDDVDAREELRLKYRYLDLRRGPLQRNLIARHHFNQTVRNYLSERDFLELETPFLIRSTPEGARDYVVPSRVHQGTFFALPQSPQIFKQLFMVGGYDKYFQITRCFRDEDLRSDRQPEFTQVDMELSFATEERIMSLVEGLIRHTFQKVIEVDLGAKFERLTYAEAMRRFGKDAPDLRFGMELAELNDLVEDCDFSVFSKTVAGGGLVKALCLPGGAERSRKQTESLQEVTKPYGAKGLAWAKVTAEGWQGGISKFFNADLQGAIGGRLQASPGDLLLFVADKPSVTNAALGNLRLHLGDHLGLRQKGTFKAVWVTDFPMFDEVELEDGSSRWVACHHPFTAPQAEYRLSMESDPGSALAQAYDLVINGHEMGGGSIRIHETEVQERMFRVLGMPEEEQREKFGFLLDAFRFGPPPHGGLALGVDRLVMEMMGADSLRDVIAFPKTNRAQDLMIDAPGRIDKAQYEELALAPVSEPQEPTKL